MRDRGGIGGFVGGKSLNEGVVNGDDDCEVRRGRWGADVGYQTGR